MSKWLKALAGGAFALFVAAALTVGAQTAFARSVTSDCPDDGWVYLGSCIDDHDCTTNCRAIHGEPDAFGRCMQGCCTCFF